MKKFVSLVLVLALALSLCTVAFAATAVGVVVASADVEADTEYALVKTGSAHDKVLEYYQIQKTETNPTTKATTVTLGTTTYSIATKDAFDYVLINGKDVTYLQSVTANTPTTAATKVATVKAAKDPKVCGDVYHTADKPVFVDADDVYYTPYAGSGDVKWLNVDGKIVKAVESSSVNTEPHNFKADVTTATVAGEATTTYSNIKCTKCGKTYTDYVTSEAKAKTAYGLKNYESITVSAGGNNVALWVAKAAASSSTTTVDSSKTFDAGVAMYVGLSLMSVAGSAVVIGKKKEF